MRYATPMMTKIMTLGALVLVVGGCVANTAPEASEPEPQDETTAAGGSGIAPLRENTKHPGKVTVPDLKLGAAQPSLR